MRKRAAIWMVMFLALSIRVAAQDNPLVGTWKLNRAKSTYSPGPGPMQMTVTFEEKGDSLHQTMNGVNAEGKPILYETTVKVDGKEYAFTGDPTRDSLTWKRVDSNSWEITTRKQGKVVASQHRVVSADGKICTLTIDGTNAQGRPTHSLEIFEKQ